MERTKTETKTKTEAKKRKTIAELKEHRYVLFEAAMSLLDWDEYGNWTNEESLEWLMHNYNFSRKDAELVLSAVNRQHQLALFGTCES